MVPQVIIDEFEQQLKNDGENWSYIIDALTELRKDRRFQESKHFQTLNFYIGKVENTSQYLQYLRIINPKSSWTSLNSGRGPVPIQGYANKRKFTEEPSINEIQDIMPTPREKEKSFDNIVTPIFKKKKVEDKIECQETQTKPGSASSTKRKLQIERVLSFDVLMTGNKKGTAIKPHLVAIFYGEGCQNNPKFYLNIHGKIVATSVRRVNADRSITLACSRQYSKGGMCEARHRLKPLHPDQMTIKSANKIFHLNVKSFPTLSVHNYEVMEYETRDHICSQDIQYSDIEHVANGRLKLKDFILGCRANSYATDHLLLNSNNNAHVNNPLPQQPRIRPAAKLAPYTLANNFTDKKPESRTLSKDELPVILNFANAPSSSIIITPVTQVGNRRIEGHPSNNS